MIEQVETPDNPPFGMPLEIWTDIHQGAELNRARWVFNRDNDLDPEEVLYRLPFRTPTLLRVLSEKLEFASFNNSYDLLVVNALKKAIVDRLMPFNQTKD